LQCLLAEHARSVGNCERMQVDDAMKNII
jgi:hypothetical protein